MYFPIRCSRLGATVGATAASGVAVANKVSVRVVSVGGGVANTGVAGSAFVAVGVGDGKLNIASDMGIDVEIAVGEGTKIRCVVAVASFDCVGVTVGKGVTVVVGAGASSVARQPVAARQRSANRSHASSPKKRRPRRIHWADWGASGRMMKWADRLNIFSALCYKEWLAGVAAKPVRWVNKATQRSYCAGLGWLRCAPVNTLANQVSSSTVWRQVGQTVRWVTSAGRVWSKT